MADFFAEDEFNTERSCCRASRCGCSIQSRPKGSSFDQALQQAGSETQLTKVQQGSWQAVPTISEVAELLF
jgi:hypothetical protein